MRLEGLTDDQRACVLHRDGALFVSAGAGSGKTMMLSSRIVYALLPESGPALSGIDRVCAITFTEAAAQEIKSRLKALLKQEGLFAEALKVEGAWISTIHGFCSRLLRSHGPELGIDPSFTVLGEQEAAQLESEAIDALLADDREIIEGSHHRLFAEHPRARGFDGGSSAAAIISSIRNYARSRRGGFDSLDLGPAPRSASALARLAHEHYEAAIELVSSLKGSATRERALALAEEALEATRALMEDKRPAQEGYEALASILDQGRIRLGNAGGAALKEAREELKERELLLRLELACALTRPLLESFIKLARQTDELCREAKARRCALDQNDLISLSVAALESHPELRAHYAERFQMVLVDEFQDTDQLQVELVNLIAGNAAEKLTTVGDAQQAIYRFRGADVHVYEAHKQRMKRLGDGALIVELAKNFRSHKEVLSMVEATFGRSGAPSSHFMPLEPHEERPSVYCGDDERIRLVAVKGPHAREECAARVADQLARLHAEGQPLGDMVILLGRMTHAQTYAEALRARGLECAVASGSGFSQSTEALIIRALLAWLANNRDSESLVEVLTSDMFGVGVDDLLHLSTRLSSDGRPSRRFVAKGMEAIWAGEEASPSVPVQEAVHVLGRAREQLDDVAGALRFALVESGWLSRLESAGAQGRATAANLLKAIRLVEGIQSEGWGLASVARRFSEMLEGGLREAPGALSGDGVDFVRLMTIHGSKGLEFPIVVVAEFERGAARRTPTLITESMGGRFCLSLAPGRLTSERHPSLSFEKSELRGLAFEGGDPFEDAARFRAAICQAEDREDLAESRRLLYVGMTRASEALIIPMSLSARTRSYRELDLDLISALGLDESVVAGVSHPAYGGDEPALLEVVSMTGEELSDDGEAAPPACACPSEDADDAPEGRRAIAFPITAAPRPKRDEPASFSDATVHSYSSLGAAATDDLPDRAGEEPRAVKGADRAAAKAEAATHLGTAFHHLAQLVQERKAPLCEADIDAQASLMGLDEKARVRLEAALDRWLGSDLFTRVAGYAHRRCEHPFFIDLGEGYLTGEIDLLAFDDLSFALIVDYKTGGSADESAEQLQEKHGLQARCYGLAAMRAGFERVALEFVRVEQDDGTGQPQIVSYEFTRNDIIDLQRTILTWHHDVR